MKQEATIDNTEKLNPNHITLLYSPHTSDIKATEALALYQNKMSQPTPIY